MLGLWLVRVGTWLCHKGSGLPVVVTLDFRDDSDEDFGGFMASRYYGFEKEVVAHDAP